MKDRERQSLASIPKRYHFFVLAMAIGIVGGALPALKAARLPLIQAMRGV